VRAAARAASMVGVRAAAREGAVVGGRGPVKVVRRAAEGMMVGARGAVLAGERAAVTEGAMAVAVEAPMVVDMTEAAMAEARAVWREVWRAIMTVVGSSRSRIRSGGATPRQTTRYPLFCRPMVHQIPSQQRRSLCLLGTEP